MKGTPELVSTELTVSGIGLGSSQDEVEKAFGMPDQIEKAPQQNLEFYKYLQKGLEVGIASDNSVHIISVSAPSDARTAKGIGIGSSMEDVKKAYGEPEPPNTYRFKGHGDGVRLQVRNKDNRVTRLYFAWGFE